MHTTLPPSLRGEVPQYDFVVVCLGINLIGFLYKTNKKVLPSYCVLFCNVEVCVGVNLITILY